MSQEMKQRMVRIAIPVAFLVYPFAVGYPLLRVFQSGLIFYVSAVVPQYLIWPYLSYYNEASARPPFAWAMVAAHWPAVLALYSYLTLRTTTLGTLDIFFAIAVGSMALAHLVLRICGYTFYPEWL